MMKRMTASPHLTEAELCRVLRGAHFSEDAFPMLRDIAGRMEEVLRAECWYEAEGDERGCIVTLGSALDALEEQYQESGAFSEAYGLDCLSLALLQNVYGALSDTLRQESGRGIGAFLFYGQQRPLREMRALFASSGQTTVRCGRSGMLRPKKSAAFLAVLSGEACDTPAFCAGCGMPRCPFRQEEGGRMEKSAAARCSFRQEEAGRTEKSAAARCSFRQEEAGGAGVCAGASQTPLMDGANLRFAPPRRENAPEWRGR